MPGFTHTDFHERLGLPKGEEGVPAIMWLNAPDVVREGLRASARGKAVVVPSVRYRLIVGLTRILPTSLVARLAETGR